MKSIWRRSLRDRHGVAALETVLVLSGFLALLFGGFDLARLMAWQHAIDRAVTAAARYAAVNSGTATVASIKQAAQTAATPILGAATVSLVQVKVQFPTSYAPGNTVTISATLKWQPAVTLTQFGSVTLASSATLTVMN